jgi:broad specificity phosphatase PhoE
MVRKGLIMCFVALALGTYADAQNDEIFTIYLVRHTEKDYTSENTSDLPLSTCGKQRSIALSSFLDDVHLDAVYSTDYTRTINTAIPTADTKDIEITLYNGQDIEPLLNILLDTKQDALVVGHSNTTGVLAGLLVNQEIGYIDLDIYDRIYQVVICGETRQLHLFHSSFECVQ